MRKGREGEGGRREGGREERGREGGRGRNRGGGRWVGAGNGATQAQCNSQHIQDNKTSSRHGTSLP